MSTPEIIKAPTKQARMLMRHLRLRGAGIRVETDLPTMTLGDGEEALVVHPDAIRRGGAVYSFGMGSQVSWDFAMIRHFGVTVHAFDPAPEVVRWAATQHWPDGFVFHPCGIGARDGVVRFYPPPTTRTLNYSSINRAAAREQDAVELPVKELRTIARELGHDRIDILKLDIEGGEFEVLPGILESGLDIPQILLEVHHQFRHLSFDDTRRAIAGLRGHGYRIFHISHRGREFGLLKPR